MCFLLGPRQTRLFATFPHGVNSSRCQPACMHRLEDNALLKPMHTSPCRTFFPRCRYVQGALARAVGQKGLLRHQRCRGRLLEDATFAVVHEPVPASLSLHALLRASALYRCARTTHARRRKHGHPAAKCQHQHQQGAVGVLGVGGGLEPHVPANTSARQAGGRGGRGVEGRGRNMAARHGAGRTALMIFGNCARVSRR